MEGKAGEGVNATGTVKWLDAPCVGTCFLSKGSLVTSSCAAISVPDLVVSYVAAVHVYSARVYDAYSPSCHVLSLARRECILGNAFLHSFLSEALPSER
jgi:hypothetical protein